MLHSRLCSCHLSLREVPAREIPRVLWSREKYWTKSNPTATAMVVTCTEEAHHLRQRHPPPRPRYIGHASEVGRTDRVPSSTRGGIGSTDRNVFQNHFTWKIGYIYICQDHDFLNNTKKLYVHNNCFRALYQLRLPPRDSAPKCGGISTYVRLIRRRNDTYSTVRLHT